MIFVTGGTGLTGSHLLYKLCQTNDKIIALKQKSSNINRVKQVFKIYSEKANELFDKISWVDGDIRNKYQLIELTKNVSAVYHTAAYVSYNKRKKQKIFDVNINGTKNIVNACLINKVNSLSYVSSIASLGDSVNGELIDENTEWSDVNTTNYSKSKYFAELEVWRGVEEELKTVIINPSVILGPGFWESGSSAIFSTIKKGLKYYTNGTTGFVDVRDVVDILVKLTEKEIFNQRFVVSSDNIDYKTLFAYIAKRIDAKVPDKYATKRLTKIAYTVEEIKSYLFNTNPLITKETSQTAHKKLKYSNKKISETIDYKFIDILKSIDFITDIYNNLL